MTSFSCIPLYTNTTNMYVWKRDVNFATIVLKTMETVPFGVTVRE